MDIEAQVREGQAINAACEAQARKLTRKAYNSKTELSTPYKIWQDVNSQDKRISLEIVRQWFRENTERTKQVGGARNSFVALRAHFEYQAFLHNRQTIPKSRLSVRLIYDRCF